MDNMKYFLGIDIGSVSVNTVIVDENKNIVDNYYDYCHGHPFKTLLNRLENIKVGGKYEFSFIAMTGTGGKLASELLNASFVNEIIAQSTAVSKLYPNVKTVIEMGGEDSKLIFMEEMDKDKGSKLSDFTMNSLCAAGTGSFLDQQAKRMGISIENEFGELALKSEKPPRIAGRCSVFAKSDMIHLQQIGTPVHDIVAGLCFAVARSFKSNIGRGKDFKKPIAFQGGVAANSGLVKAFEDILGLKEGDLMIPQYNASMGAIGAVFVAMDDKVKHVPASLPSNGSIGGSKQGTVSRFKGLSDIEDYLRAKKVIGGGLERLSSPHNGHNDIHTIKINDSKKTDVVIGIDVGSL